MLGLVIEVGLCDHVERSPLSFNKRKCGEDEGGGDDIVGKSAGSGGALCVHVSTSTRDCVCVCVRARTRVCV